MYEAQSQTWARSVGLLNSLVSHQVRWLHKQIPNQVKNIAALGSDYSK